MSLRPVNLHVTGSAVLVSRRRLIMERRRAGSADRCAYVAVALEAELPDIIAFE